MFIAAMVGVLVTMLLALVVWGANDGMTPPKYGRAYAKHINGARFTLIPRAGHYPHVEQPGAFLRKIEKFLG